MGGRYRTGRSWVRRATSRAVRSVLIILTFTLVIGLGVSVSSEPDLPPDLTITEKAQNDAYARAGELAATAAELAAQPGSDGAAADALRTAGAILQSHAAALARPAPAQRQEPDAESAGEPLPTSPTATATAAAPPTMDGYLAALTASATAGLADARRSDGGVARLLASTAAGQWHQAVLLQSSLEGVAPVAPLPELLTSATAAGADGETGVPDPGAGPAPSGSGPVANCDAAPLEDADTGYLRRVAVIERRAAYAYRVGASRLPDPAPALERAAVHRAVAADAEQRLANRCASHPGSVPVYSLNPAFLEDPASGLGLLEAELAGSYADLVGLSSGSLRGLALKCFAASWDAAAAAGIPAETFPGILTAPPTAAPSNTAAPNTERESADNG